MEKIRVWRKPHFEVECDLFRCEHMDAKKPYIVCIDPVKRDMFIATIHLGVWMELDVNEIYYILTKGY